jgi:hypothetical protein
VTVVLFTGGAWSRQGVFVDGNLLALSSFMVEVFLDRRAGGQAKEPENQESIYPLSVHRGWALAGHPLEPKVWDMGTRLQTLGKLAGGCR